MKIAHSQTYRVSSKNSNLASQQKTTNLSQILKRAANTPSRMIKNIFFHTNERSPRTTASARKNLRELIRASSVVNGSSESAKKAFVNTARFNGIKTDVTITQKLQLTIDKARLAEGDIGSFVGKGIIAGKHFLNELPVKCDYVRVDKSIKETIGDTRAMVSGICAYTGEHIIASELIPGTPLGNYHNQQDYSSSLNVLQLENGDCGTIGFKINIRDLPCNQQLLIHGGELSGCTVVFAQKGDDLFAFHAGQLGNDASAWETGSDGVKSIIQSYDAMTGGANIDDDMIYDNQMLADFLAKNFDFSSLTYCGHNESVSDHKNVSVFNYNSEASSVGDNKVRVGNAMLILTNKDNKPHIECLSDDMTINKNTLTTESIGSSISTPK